jgi:hypothetical protein
MSVIVYVIRDHFGIFHNCDSFGDVEYLIGDNFSPENGKLLWLSSCGVISNYCDSKEIKVECKNCGEKYIVGSYDARIAKKSFDDFFESLR